MVDEERDASEREPGAVPSMSKDRDGAASSKEDDAEGGESLSKPPVLGKGTERQPAAWGEPIQRFSNAWMRFDVRLCVVVLLAEILALCAWVLLKGLSAPPGSDSPAGVIVRAALGATVLGTATYFVVRKKNASLVRFATSAAIVIGLVVAKAWDGLGSVYFSNLLNWMQDASSLTLIDGLRGLGTRLTVWLAMLGGSLAAASGKHIHIDVVRRFLPERLRMPTTVLAWLGAVAVCFSAAWGFTDHIAIGSYHVDRHAPASEKLSTVANEASLGFFVLRKQLVLDAGTLPVVLSGEPYDSWLTNEKWNERVTDAGWEDYFEPEEVERLQMRQGIADESRMPLVIVPGTSASGMLKHLLNLVFPLGFLIIGLRFLVRSVLVVSGHVRDEQQVELASGEPGLEKGAER